MPEIKLIPEQAATFAPQVDHLIWALTALSALFTGIVAVLIVVLAYRYRKNAIVDRKLESPDHTPLELTWTIIPGVLAIPMFFWAAYVYAVAKNPPENSLDIHVVGKQWMWKIQHGNGRMEVNELHVPTGQPVKLVMTSQDVIHSFFVPAFRQKMDVLPGRYTNMWFEATKPGKYRLFCAEYCGTEHSRMGGWVYVMEPQAYEEWLTKGNPVASAGGTGEKLFTKLGCVTCHMAGTRSRGPELAGVFGTEVMLNDGSKVKVDEEYIRESIMTPMAKIVSGYTPLMPTYKGQVSPEEVAKLIEYIKSLKKE